MLNSPCLVGQSSNDNLQKLSLMLPKHQQDTENKQEPYTLYGFSQDANSFHRLVIVKLVWRQTKIKTKIFSY